MKKSIDRIVIETIVEQSIQGFRNDPHREIRKLVDLGASTANSRFQHLFFEIAQDILAHDSSLYYQMISQIAESFPSKAIKHFFINVGYNSWTRGARAIRLMKVERGHSIPWTLIFQNGTRTLCGDKLLHILEEARALGIYTFFFFTDDAFPMSEVLKLAQKFADCAFILLIGPEENLNTNISAWSEATNCLFLFQTQHGNIDTENILSACREAGVLYGLWMRYDTKDLSNILNGKMTELAEKQGSTLFLLVQRDNCDPETTKMAKEYVSREQLAPQHAVFMIDLYSDVLRVDQIISNGNCLAFIKANGTLSVSKSTVTANLCTDTLISGLHKAAPLT